MQKKRKLLNQPSLGDSNEIGDDEEVEIFDVTTLSREEARRWFLRVDSSNVKKGRCAIECPSCNTLFSLNTIYHHIPQCIKLRNTIFGIDFAEPGEELKVEIKPEATTTTTTTETSTTAKPEKEPVQATVVEIFDLSRCCIPIQKHGPKAKISSTQRSLLVTYGTISVTVCALEHWRDEQLTNYIKNSFPDKPSCISTTEKSVNCELATCGSRTKGPTRVEKVLRLNSIKRPNSEDTIGWFCCLDHVIEYARNLSADKIRRKLKGSESQGTRGIDDDDEYRDHEGSNHGCLGNYRSHCCPQAENLRPHPPRHFLRSLSSGGPPP